jgi:hypothetical protein
MLDCKIHTYITSCSSLVLMSPVLHAARRGESFAYTAEHTDILRRVHDNVHAYLQRVGQRWQRSAQRQTTKDCKKSEDRRHVWRAEKYKAFP